MCIQQNLQRISHRWWYSPNANFCCCFFVFFISFTLSCCFCQALSDPFQVISKAILLQQTENSRKCRCIRWSYDNVNALLLLLLLLVLNALEQIVDCNNKESFKILNVYRFMFIAKMTFSKISALLYSLSLSFSDDRIPYKVLCWYTEAFQFQSFRIRKI